jgi:hypothetical protein
LTPPGFIQTLYLKYDILVSKFAFKFNLYRYTSAPHYALMFSLLEAITGAERKVLHTRNKEILEKVPIFGNMAEEKLDRLAHGVRVQKFKRGDVIVHEGDKVGLFISRQTFVSSPRNQSVVPQNTS